MALAKVKHTKRTSQKFGKRAAKKKRISCKGKAQALNVYLIQNNRINSSLVH